MGLCHESYFQKYWTPVINGQYHLTDSVSFQSSRLLVRFHSDRNAVAPEFYEERSHIYPARPSYWVLQTLRKTGGQIFQLSEDPQKQRPSIA